MKPLLNQKRILSVLSLAFGISDSGSRISWKLFLIGGILVANLNLTFAQQGAVIVAKVNVDSSLGKKWADEGRVALLERAMGALETQALDTLRETHLFPVIEENTAQVSAESNDPRQPMRLINPDDFFLNITVTDFENKATVGAQGQTTVDTSSQRRAQEAQMRFLVQQLSHVKQPGRRVVIQTKIDEIRRSMTTHTQLDKASQLTRSLDMALRFRLSKGDRTAELQTGAETFKTNGFSTILTDDLTNAKASEDLLRGATASLARQVTTRVAEQISPAKVLEKKENEVIINWGTGCGVINGQTYLVYTKKEMTDPDTKRSLGMSDIQVGKIRISQTNDKFASARIIDDNGIAPGSMVRRLVR